MYLGFFINTYIRVELGIVNIWTQTINIGTMSRYSSTGNLELFNTHKNRLVIEQDANMLANRISMLQLEEEKILK